MPSEAPAFRVLIVEDEYFIANDLARALARDGMIALGPVADQAAAVDLMESASVDFAVVDINLDGAISFAVATELRGRGIPFLFYTGYDASIVPAQFSDTILLQKPNSDEAIIAEIKHVRAIAAPV